MGAWRNGVGLLGWVAAVGGLFGAPACTSFDCQPHACPGREMNICDRGDGYVRLEDGDGNKLYECFCTVDTMKGAAAKICTEGAVCRKARSPCKSSGDCCAGLVCSVGVCG